MRAVRIRRQRKKVMVFILSLLCILYIGMISIHVDAEANAVFHVQASEEKEDDKIRVAVYLTDVENLGGVEAQFLYDPSKVTYITSGLGTSFSDGYGDTHCDEATSTVKCVAVYPEAKSAHGELMYVIFQLNGVNSYQPEFQVINLLDASTEIQAIPYSITYQQADGSWQDTRDVSENTANTGVIADARALYGAEEDQEDRYAEELLTGEKSAEELLEEAEQIQGGSQTESEQQSEEENVEEGSEMQSENIVSEDVGPVFEEESRIIILVVVIVVAIVVIIAVLLVMRYIKRKGERDEG